VVDYAIEEREQSQRQLRQPAQLYHHHYLHKRRHSSDMADVEMTDAPKTKSSKAGPSGGDAGDNKARFEVKKVRH
jgi:hypothetical protein